MMFDGPQDLFLPPREAASAAEHGLVLRERFGRGGTHVGAERARRLAALEPLDHREVRVISAWFARHGAQRRSAIRAWGDDADPSAAWIAWNLWGGDAGRAWADAIVGRGVASIRDPFMDRLAELCLV
jgi:hypothetical protein